MNKHRNPLSAHPSGVSRAMGVVGKAAAILLGGVLLGWLLLIAAYALPLAPIESHLQESMVVFSDEDGSAEVMSERTVKTYTGTWQDNRTDLLMMLFAVHESPEPLYRQAIITTRCDNPNSDLLGTLKEYLADDLDNLTDVTYGRYWHGYLTVLKPLLLFCNYMDIRMLNMLAEGALLAALLWLMQKRGLSLYLPALCGALMLLTPWVLPLSMQYMTSFYPMALGMLALLWKPDAIRSRMGDWVVFLLIGMATAYMDVLTFPLITFGFPFVVWTLLMDEKGQGNALTALVRLGLAWLVGYAGMWAGKWLLVALFGTAEEVAAIFLSIQARTSTEEISRLSAILRNVLVLWRKPYKLAALCMGVGLLFAGFRARGCREPMRWSLAAAWGLCALLPFLWYAVMADHSHTHYFYTHRILAVSAFALLCLPTRLIRRKSKPLPESGLL